MLKIKTLIILATILTASSASAMSQGKAEALTACYARLLNIPTPPVTMANYLGEGVTGRFSDGRIELVPHSDANDVAHEVRHAHQWRNNNISLLQHYFVPYEFRTHEVDARRWAANNEHRCVARRVTKKSIKAKRAASVKIFCSNGHKVVKGDTWWKLHNKYKLKGTWLDHRAGTVLKLGARVCVK